MAFKRSKSKTHDERLPRINQETVRGGEEEPYRQSAAQVLAALRVDGQLGLSTAAAANRLKRCGRNELTAEKPVPPWSTFLAPFTDAIFLLLIRYAERSV